MIRALSWLLAPHYSASANSYASCQRNLGRRFPGIAGICQPSGAVSRWARFNPTRRYTHFRGTLSSMATSSTLRSRLMPSSPALYFRSSDESRESNETEGNSGGGPESCRQTLGLVNFSLFLAKATLGLSLYRFICHSSTRVHHSSDRSTNRSPRFATTTLVVDRAKQRAPVARLMLRRNAIPVKFLCVLHESANEGVRASGVVRRV